MAEELSKSGKKRAAKKLRDENFAVEAAPPPAPEPKAKAKAKAEAKAAPSPAAEQPKAKAKGKAKAAPAPAPEPEPKAKAKGKAKAAPAPEPVKEAPKAKAKAKAAAAEPAPKAEPKSQPKAQPKQKAAAKAKAAAKEEEAEVVKREELIQPFTMDDGSGGWEMSTGLSKKAEKTKERKAQAEAAAKANSGKAIPGMGPANSIPGMAPAVQRTSQAEINAVLQRAKAAGVTARAQVEAEAAEAAKANSGMSTASVMVPEARIGVVIGPKGKNIQLIQEKTGVGRIDTSGEMFTITGKADAVEHAERAIKELITKGYWSESFENFQEEAVAVHPSSFPDLIGKGGVVIKAMKSEFGVEVTIPEVPKNAPVGKKYKVTLAGKKENVEEAKKAINNIAMYGYDEMTHPGYGHEELEVPQWAYSFLIGKAGSELRHIQNNYKVKVNIPREHSMCQSVVCVGEKANVERAKQYIEKLLWNAENQTKGRDKADGAEDHWGKEDDEEDWMKAYMYKR